MWGFSCFFKRNEKDKVIDVAIVTSLKFIQSCGEIIKIKKVNIFDAFPKDVLEDYLKDLNQC